MVSICILQTQSPLKHLPDSIAGHSDFLFWGGGTMLTLSCSWKKCCCHPVQKSGACLTCWCVTLSPMPEPGGSSDWLSTCVHGLLYQQGIHMCGWLFLACWVWQQNLPKQKWQVHGDPENIFWGLVSLHSDIRPNFQLAS